LSKIIAKTIFHFEIFVIDFFQIFRNFSLHFSCSTIFSDIFRARFFLLFCETFFPSFLIFFTWKNGRKKHKKILHKKIIATNYKKKLRKKLRKTQKNPIKFFEMKNRFGNYFWHFFENNFNLSKRYFVIITMSAFHVFFLIFFSPFFFKNSHKYKKYSHFPFDFDLLARSIKNSTTSRSDIPVILNSSSSIQCSIFDIFEKL